MIYRHCCFLPNLLNRLFIGLCLPHSVERHVEEGSAAGLVGRVVGCVPQIAVVLGCFTFFVFTVVKDMVGLAYEEGFRVRKAVDNA